MKNDKLNLLIVSDLHAHPGDPNLSSSPSFLSSNNLYTDLNPLRKIPDLLKAENLDTDWLVCPGDLGDKAEPSAQKFAWEQLAELKKDLNASALIGTAGNHDLDSRRVFPDFDLKGMLQLLSPSFPVELNCFEANDGVYQDRYWSKNFVVVPFPDFDCTLLILNSCGFHGYATTADGKSPHEHMRGKISALTRNAVAEATKNLETRLNIALVHHHPIKLPYIDDGNSIMVGGSELIDVLKQSKRQWLVVHGHQHIPYLTYADSDPLAPVILSAGSVAARTYPTQGTHPRNQIHHITIPLSEMEPGGLDLLGRVRSWSWINTDGWKRALPDAGIPYEAGFGYRFDLKETRDKILSMTKTDDLVSWDSVAAKIPRLNYLVPKHLQGLLEAIELRGVVIEKGEFGTPRRLELKQ